MALLRITETTEALRLEGEIDLAVADQLAEALQSSIESGTTTVDVSGVTFIDSTGLRIILSAGNRLNEQGPLALRNPSKAVRRLLDIALPGGVPTLAVLDE
jgi:anti-anti-sigma factor